MDAGFAYFVVRSITLACALWAIEAIYHIQALSEQEINQFFPWARLHLPSGLLMQMLATGTRLRLRPQRLISPSFVKVNLFLLEDSTCTSCEKAS